MAVDIERVLQDLVGRTIPTMTGKPNRVLGLTGTTVTVATSRSPSGQPVDIAEIQAAADELFRRGEIEISKATVGYRSAFVGAVLATLPETVSETNPRRIRLETR